MKRVSHIFALTSVILSIAISFPAYAMSDSIESGGVAVLPPDFEPVVDMSNSTVFINKTEIEIPTTKPQDYTIYLLFILIIALLLSIVFFQKRKKEAGIIVAIITFLATINSGAAFTLGDWNQLAQPATFTLSGDGGSCYDDDSSCYNPHCTGPFPDTNPKCNYNECPWGCCMPASSFQITEKRYAGGWIISTQSQQSVVRGSVFKGYVKGKTTFKCTPGDAYQETDWSANTDFTTEVWKGCNDDVYRCARPPKAISTPKFSNQCGAYFFNLYLYKFYRQGGSVRPKISWGYNSYLLRGDSCTKMVCSFCNGDNGAYGNPKIPGPPVLEAVITDFFVPATPALNSPAHNTVNAVNYKPDFSFTTANKGDGYKLRLYKKSSENWVRINSDIYKRVAENPDNGISMSFTWDEYKGGLSSEYQNGFTPAIYKWQVTSCSYELDDYYDCFDDEPTSEREFAVNEQPSVTLQVFDGQTEVTGSQNWYNRQLRAKVTCSDTKPDTDFCDLVGIKIYNYNPGSCPDNENEYELNDNNGNGISIERNIDARKWVCGIGKDSYGWKSKQGPVEAKVDVNAPTFSCTSDTASVRDIESKINWARYCDYTAGGNCDPESGESFPNCASGMETCSVALSMPGGTFRKAKAADIAGNTAEKTYGVDLVVSYPANNMWKNTDQTATYSTTSSSGATVKFCSVPYSDGANCNAVNSAQSPHTFSDEQDSYVKYEATEGECYKKDSHSIRVKIDKTSPRISAAWSTGEPLSTCRLQGNSITVSVDDSKPGISVSGLGETKYCIYKEGESPCTQYTVLGNENGAVVSKGYSVGTSGLSAGNWKLRVVSADTAGNTNQNNPAEFTFCIKGTVSGTIDYPAGFWKSGAIDQIKVTDTTPNPPGNADKFKLYKKAGRTIDKGTGNCNGDYSQREQIGFTGCDGAYSSTELSCTFTAAREDTVTVSGLQSGKCYKFEAEIIKGSEYATATSSNELKVDYTNPTVTINAPNLYEDSSGQKWTKNLFSVSWSASDSESGLNENSVKITYPKTTGTGELTNQPLTGQKEYPTNFPSAKPIEHLQSYSLTASLTDRAGNTGSETVSVKADTQPPTCTLTAPDTASPPPAFTVSWTGSDSGSGLKEYEIGLKDNLGNALNINDGYCDTSAAVVSGSTAKFSASVTSMSCPWTGKQDGTYTFTCRPKDNVDNIGAETIKQTTIDRAPVSSSLSVPRWAKSEFKITISASGAVQCLYLQYMTNNNGIWHDYTDPSGNACLAAGEHSSDRVPDAQANGNDIVFRVKSRKASGIEEQWPCCSALSDQYASCSDNPSGCASDSNRIKVTTIDNTAPETGLEPKPDRGIDIGHNIIVPPTDGDLRLRFSFRDAISGVENSYVSWSGGKQFTGCDQTSEGSNTINCGQTTPKSNEQKTKDLSNDYTGLTTIELTTEVTDRAENTNKITYFATDHPIAYFGTETIFLHTGESYTLTVTARNLLQEDQTINLLLLGYDLAEFVESGSRSISFPLDPEESKQVHIQIEPEVPDSIDQPEQKEDLVMKATSSKLTYEDRSTAKIFISWPSSFSAFGQIATVLSVLFAFAVFVKLI